MLSVSRDKFEVLIKKEALQLHVPGIHIHDNITFYYVHGTSYNVGMCRSGISTKISSKVYVPVKTETSSFIKIIHTISCINMNGIFTVIGGYMYGVINNRSFITVN